MRSRGMVLKLVTTGGLDSPRIYPPCDACSSVRCVHFFFFWLRAECVPPWILSSSALQTLFYYCSPDTSLLCVRVLFTRFRVLLYCASCFRGCRKTAPPSATQSHCCHVVRVRLGHEALLRAGYCASARDAGAASTLVRLRTYSRRLVRASGGWRQAWWPLLLGEPLPSHVPMLSPHVPAIQRRYRRHRQHGCRRVILSAGAPLPW